MNDSNISFSLSSDNPSDYEGDGLLLPVFQEMTAKPPSPEKQKSAKWTDTVNKSDELLRGIIGTTIIEEKFDASAAKTLIFRKTPSDAIKVRRLVLYGLGLPEKCRLETVEKSVRTAMEGIAIENRKSIAIVPPVLEGTPNFHVVQVVIDAVFQACYKSLQAKDSKDEPLSVLIFASDITQKELFAGIIMARARCFARDLTNTPPNLKSTDTMADAARGLAELTGVEVDIISDTKWIAQHMPAFYAVSRGSLASDPPKFIQVRYRHPAGRAKNKLAVIGKTVIFDTGGYQVKPDSFMNTMKADMTGGAMALAALRAVAELQLTNVDLDVYLAATPNKIDSDAMVPDSIVGSTCGKKIEIRHTDAEGRLTLIDALSKACENKPNSALTVATLTGSAARAVGLCVALMANNDSLRTKIEKAAKSSGDPVQTLDIFEEDYDDIKSKLDAADIINTSQNKNRGAQSAAAFVMTGAAEGISVAHMDIAGADMTTDEKATGIGVKTIVRWIMNEDASLG